MWHWPEYIEGEESVVLHNGDEGGGELGGPAKHAELVHHQDEGGQAVGGGWGELKTGVTKKKEAGEEKIQFFITFCVPHFPPSCFLFSRLPSHKIFTKIDHDASLISSMYTPNHFLDKLVMSHTIYIQQDYPNFKTMVNVRF